MFSSYSINNSHMAATYFPVKAIHSPSNQDLTPAHSSTPTRLSTKDTLSDLEAALILLQLRASSINKPTATAAAHIKQSSYHPPSSKYHQASKTDDKERQRRRENAIAYQRRWRAKQPNGHRRAEYRRYMDRVTESHREERLRKDREAQKARRSRR